MNEAEVAKLAASLTRVEIEQVKAIRPAQTWSCTHGWTGIRDNLQCKGLIAQTNSSKWTPVTDPTPLGLAVRDHLKGLDA